MTPTHRMTKDSQVCGRPSTLIAAGTEVELVRIEGDRATVKPSDGVWQLVPLESIEEL